jgi:hypothetical protein
MKKKTNIGLLAGGILSALLAWASEPASNTTPVAFSAYDFTTTPTGVLATLEFDTQNNRLYSILRSPNLSSNDWNVIAADIPGTGSNMIYTDLVPLTELARFYKAAFTAAPPANLLQNSDFETGTPTADRSTTFNASPWVWYNHNGNNNAWLTDDTFDPIVGTDNQALEFRWGLTTIYQDFAAIADRTYLLSVDALNPGDASNGLTATLRVEWYDASSAIIGSTILIDESNNSTDPLGVWFELSGSAVAPAGAVTGRIILMCNKNGATQNYFFDNAYVALQPLGAAVVSSSWTSFGNASRVAAAQYAGHYVVADSDIEITAIDESIIDTITASEIAALLPGAGINAIAFTSSGRQMFISANGTSSDSVLAYNAGTGQLRNFVTGLNLSSGVEKLGIAHFKGELFVGSATGEIRRYAADLNDATGSYNGSISLTGGDAGQPVRGIAADIRDKMLYVASPNNLYSLNPTNSVLTQIAAISNVVDITYGRTYGANGQGGLLILQDNGNERILHLISNANLQAGGSVTPEPYYETGNIIPAIAATACGRLLTAGTTPGILSDSNDSRMDFMTWVADEFDQNVRFAKVLCWQDAGDLTGMVNNTVKKSGSNRGETASPDAAYWVVNQLIMSDEVNGDPEAQPLVREIIKRYAQLEVNSDGQWYHWYDMDTGARKANSPTTSCYSTMKGVHMAIRAKEYYPNDSEIITAANTIIGRLRNQRDYSRDFGRYASPADNLGPVIAGHEPGPYQEIHLFGELMAATEPMAENNYLQYWRYRDNHTYNYELPDEPIIKTAMAGFWRMYDQATIQFCRDDAAWKQEFRNFYALFAGWTDDNAPEHLTAFSAGNTPSGYSSDKYTVHPGTVNSFGTVIGFGLHGNTVPVVGAYFAYRDGRRQLMGGSASYAAPDLLTRISYEDPSWVTTGLSPTDHQYAGYALGEILSPGSIDRAIAVHTYLEPQWHSATNGDKVVEFSKLVRRQVLGTADGTNWDSLGFQYSPFTVPASSSYTNFMVVGAEGELLDPSSETATEQDYDVSADFDGTIYIVRAVTASATAQVRAQWYNGASFLSEQTGAPSGLDAIKPTTATILRVALVEGVTPVAADQLSVVLDGALETFFNDDFENGNFNGWTTYQQTGMGKANVADSRLGGSRACALTASLSAANGKYAQVWHEYDISTDPTNTHYVLEFDALTENLEGSSLRTILKVYSSSNTVLRTEEYDTFENANTKTMLSAGFRKRDADHTKARFHIRLRRDDQSAVTADERVLIDNLRLLKMKP